MQFKQDPPKTPSEYRITAQLTSKGLSSDFTNYLSYRMQFDTIAMLSSTPGKESSAQSLFDGVVEGLKKTPTYSEKYLNKDELLQAAAHGVKREDLINSETEPAIERLDNISLRFRQIGMEITLENYKNLKRELDELCGEALALIRG